MLPLSTGHPDEHPRQNDSVGLAFAWGMHLNDEVGKERNSRMLRSQCIVECSSSHYRKHHILKISEVSGDDDVNIVFKG